MDDDIPFQRLTASRQARAMRAFLRPGAMNSGADGAGITWAIDSNDTKTRLAEVKDRHGHGRAPEHGTLQVGAAADLSILEVVEGPASFVDTRSDTAGQVYLRPVDTVVAGVWRLAGRNSRRSGPG